MREYYDLQTLLTYETAVKDPRDAADRLIKSISTYAPDFEILVCFVGPDPLHPWLVLPIPSEALRNLDDASVSRLGDGRVPVAYWKRSQL